MFFRFAPRSCANTAGVLPSCAVHKVEGHVSTDHIVPGGAHHNHAMGPEGVSCQCVNGDAGASFQLSSPDARLLSVGTPSAFPTPLNGTGDVESEGVALMLWQNIWNTNYIMWTEGNFQFTANIVLGRTDA